MINDLGNNKWNKNANLLCIDPIHVTEISRWEIDCGSSICALMVPCIQMHPEIIIGN